MQSLRSKSNELSSQHHFLCIALIIYIVCYIFNVRLLLALLLTCLVSMQWINISPPHTEIKCFQQWGNFACYLVKKCNNFSTFYRKMLVNKLHTNFLCLLKYDLQLFCKKTATLIYRKPPKLQKFYLKVTLVRLQRYGGWVTKIFSHLHKRKKKSVL